MSELRTYDVIMTPSSDGSWVLKSEADKVIAEKDKEELHHLHTDGPKPLYKKIAADEYKRLKARIAELERKDTEHTVQIAKMNVYIHHLEEERRWRKFPDEMPQKYDDGDCFLIAVEHESTTSPKGYYETIAELVDGSWSDDEGRDIDEYIEYEYDLDNSLFHSQAPKGKKKGFYRNKVTHWMPLPPAPKEDK